MSKKRKRGKRKFTIPLAPIIGIVAAPSVRQTVDDLMKGDFNTAMAHAGHIVGIQTDGKFNAQLLISNIGPMVIGGLVHKLVGGAPLNLNRMLASANVPVIRI